MNWIKVVSTDKRREYILADRVVKVAFVADAKGNETATLYVTGSGDQLVSVGQVSDPEPIESLRILVGELPSSIPVTAAGPPRPA